MFDLGKSLLGSINIKINALTLQYKILIKRLPFISKAHSGSRRYDFCSLRVGKRFKGSNSDSLKSLQKHKEGSTDLNTSTHKLITY